MIKPKKSVQKMKPYNPPLEDRRDFIRLDFNENTIGCSPKVLEAIKNINLNLIASYPEYSKFYKKLSKFLGIKKSQLVVTNGGDEAIKLTIDVYLDKGEKIIIPMPTFPLFKFYATLVGGKVIEILYNKDLSFPLEKILEKITKKTKVVVLVNPNSPTGTLIKRKYIMKILTQARNSLVILDEAYIQFSKENCADLIDKYDNLAIIRSFSKAFGLAGLRLGYIITNEKIVKNLKKANSPYSVNSIAIAAASVALEDKQFIDNYVKIILENRKRLYAQFNKLGVKTYPSKANFILAYFGKNASKVELELKKRGILVRNQSEKPLLKDCIRFTVGTNEQTDKLIEALKEIL